MANVKNFGLVGVGSELQFSKGGSKVVQSSGDFSLRNAADSADVALTLSALTASTGNVTATAGNLVLGDNAGKVTIGGTDMLERSSGGYPQLAGSAAALIPTGGSAGRPGSAVAGMVRVNNDTPSASYIEFYNGTAWTALATGGSTSTLQAEIDAIETSLGSMVNTAGVFQGSVFNTANPTIWPSNPTDLTNALETLADYVDGKNTLDEIFPSTAAGNVIYSNGSNQWVQAAPGATSGVQAYSAKLTSLAGNATNGIIVQDSSGTVVARTLVAPSEGLTISNADGVSGNPTFALANDLAGLEGLTTTGFAVRTATDTWTTRSITGTAGRITVADGAGIAASPTIDLATVTDSGVGTFNKVTVDGYGRVTGTEAVTSSDITGLVAGIYVDVTGDTMTGNLTMSSGATVTGLPNPVNGTDAANKNYVDAAAAGLSWKQAVRAATTADITLSGAQTIDGVSIVAGDRVLVKNQTSSPENGIYVAAAGAWARSSDMDTASEFSGATVFVQEGSTQADTGWTQTSEVTTVGTDPVTWVQFTGAGTYNAGIGLSLTGNTFNVNLGAGIAQLPSDEVGIDLYDGANGALILTADGSTRSANSGDKLYLLLDPAGALGQTSAGLKINATSVTNAMLVNSSVTLNPDGGGTGSLALGGTLNLFGTAAQGITTTATGSTFTITASNATSAASAGAAQKGVSSFDSASFTSTAGFVTLNTVDVAHGGTGATSFTANQVLYGNGTAAIQSSSDFTFVPGATDTLTIGGAQGVSLSSDGVDGFVTSLATNSDLVLLPNGTGSVVVGPAGAGLIQSDAGQALTVRGNTTLTLQAVNGDVILTLASGTTDKVSISGPTASDYATSLADNDVPNKYYVDQAIQSGAASGSVKAVKVTVPLNANGTTNIGAQIPANATVLSVKVIVDVVDASATLSVGKTGSVSAYMTTSENDPQTQGIYLAETYVTEGSATQVIATVASSTGAGSGSARVLVEYQVA